MAISSTGERKKEKKHNSETSEILLEEVIYKQEKNIDRDFMKQKYY